ncbi:MAG: hypothetical protein HQM16_15410 [Deltaproteobacteria bacterium]|nr:hypothetical protein [Deltaproteobacteria bacterium]
MKTTVSKRFPNASVTLKNFFDQMQIEVADLKINSAETFHKMKARVLVSWSKWPDVINNYKASIQEMPKALRRMDFIKESLAQIESCEADLKNFIAEIRETSFQDFKDGIDKRLKGADFRVKALQLKFKEMSLNLDELQERTLVQKFLHGERVLSARENLQWRRKIFHCCSGLFFFYLFVYAGLSQTTIHVIGWTYSIFAVSVETCRHLNSTFNDWCCWIFEPIMREREKTKINSAVLYIVTMWVVYLLFPIEVSMLAILFIGVGDPVAGIVGVRWGRIKIKPHVSLEGFIACAAACGVISFILAGFLFDKTLSILPLVLFSMAAGLVGAFAESSFKKLDDNLVMPLLSAPCLWILLMVFGVI